MPKRIKGRRRQHRRGGAKLNVRQKKQVKRLITSRQEKKFFISNTSSWPVSTTPSVFQLSVIPQGDTDTSRDGDRLMITKVYVRGYWTFSNDLYNTIRLIFFQWKPNTTPAATDILLAGPSASVDTVSQYNHDNRQLYKIMWDKFYHIEGNGTTSSQPLTSTGIRPFHAILHMPNKQLQYVAGSTTGTNQFYYLAVTDSSVTSDPTLTMSVKFMFTDS